MTESPEIHFTPEQELLLWSIRVDHAKDQRIEEILKAGVDWNYVRETAIQHGIIPLLYKRLKEEMAVLVPSNELEELRTLFMANAVQNLRMTQQLIKVLDLLANAGIEAMPFKGPALAVQAYGDLSMRSYNDLDILIHKEDFDRMYAVLLNAGYIPKNKIDSTTKKKLTMLEKDITFFSRGICLEVHWNVVEHHLSIPIDIGELFERAVPISLNGKNIKTLSLEDSIISICIHGTKHYWNELKWLADLNFIIGNTDINWEDLIKQIELARIKRIMATSFYLGKIQCGIKLPSDVENVFFSDNIMHLTQYNKLKVFNPPSAVIFSAHRLFFLKMRERKKDQVTYILKLLTNRLFIPDSYDFKFVQIPEIFFPVYIVLRPFRLVTGYFNSFSAVQLNKEK